MSTSTALKTSPSLNVPAAADAPVVKAPVRLAHPRCVLERIKRIQALEAPPRPAPAARTSSEGSASSSTPSTDVDEAWVDSVLSGGEAADPPTATKPLPSTATKRKSPEVEAEAEPAEKKPKPSPLRSRLAEAQLRARAAGRSDAVSWVYDENDLLLGAKCDGDFFTRCAPPTAPARSPPRPPPPQIAHVPRLRPQARDPELAEVILAPRVVVPPRPVPSRPLPDCKSPTELGSVLAPCVLISVGSRVHAVKCLGVRSSL